jgi:hypothetical protein
MKSNQQRYAIFNNGLHEYTVTVDTLPSGELYTLYHSGGQQWSEDWRNTRIMALIDNGNGIRYTKARKATIDYSQVAEEAALLHAYSVLTSSKLFDNDIVSLATLGTQS